MLLNGDNWGRTVLRAVYDGARLDRQQSEQLVGLILADELSPIISGALLALLSQRGETSDEVAGALQAVAQAMKTLRLEDLLAPGGEFYDVVGTGGDGKHCVNLSTATAVCLAAMGFPCAKHGNRAQSGLVGSADIIELCGIPIDLDGEAARDFFRQHHFLYLFAPHYHPAFRHTVPIRRALRLPTLFNLLGPLSNPSRPAALAVGASSVEKARLLSKAALQVGGQRVLCYSSQDGYDEVSCAAPTQVFYRGDLIYTIEPQDFFSPCPMPQVSDSMHALERFRTALSGRDQQLNCALALNLALCLAWVVAPEAPNPERAAADFGRAYGHARDFIIRGEGLKKLESMRI